jgi:ABC-type transport system substrate-binding protein
MGTASTACPPWRSCQGRLKPAPTPGALPSGRLKPAPTPGALPSGRLKLDPTPGALPSDRLKPASTPGALSSGRLKPALTSGALPSGRLQPASTFQHDLAQGGIQLEVRSTELPMRLGDAARGSFQLYSLQLVGVTGPDMLRRVYHSRPEPPAGLNRVFYRNAEVERLIEEAALRASDEARRVVYGRAQQRIAQDLPYIPLWYRSTVAVCQPSIDGATLSPIADFAFLKDVYRKP